MPPRRLVVRPDCRCRSPRLPLAALDARVRCAGPRARDGAVVARVLSPRRAAHRRAIERRRLRVAAARRAHRHLRPAPERIAEPAAGHRLGVERAQGRRIRRRAQRADDGAALGARPRAPRDARARPARDSRCSASAAASARRPAASKREVLVVDSFDALERRAREARGRIVVFDVPYTNYGETVRYRVAGASRAARAGAVAMLLRSVGPVGLRTPHTGALSYADGIERIPAAAIAAEDAAMLARMQSRGTRVRMRLIDGSGRSAAKRRRPTSIAELRGRELPGEIVVARRPSRLLGRRHRRERRWRGVPDCLGSAAADEAGGPAAAAHGAPGAVHERGERPARRHELSRAPSRRAAAARDDGRGRHGRVRAVHRRLQRIEPRARAHGVA